MNEQIILFNKFIDIQSKNKILLSKVQVNRQVIYC